MLKKCFIFLLPVLSLFAKTPSYDPQLIPQTSPSTEFEAKDFSHLLGHLKGIDDDLFKMHFTLYNGYVKNASALLTSLTKLREKGKDTSLEYGALERRFVWEFDGMVLHELYFENLGPKPFLDRKDPLRLKMIMDFGSVEQWKKNFVATGLIKGVGWVILYQCPKSGHLKNIWVDEHNINLVPGGKPLLIMDVWEHAYITEYGLDRAGYIEAFMQNIDWEVVSARYKEAESSK
ncbi:superoxide dismutase [Simkania sp.]|uniref:superoxide dismutase n=1 Tax=Simkania sp. TaxID=34094 RepID=UPI003B51D7AB